MPGFILAIDQGTTNTKALLVGDDGQPVFRTSTPVPLLTPRPGFVEQDPELLWNSVKEVIRACVTHAGTDAIQGVAISNQRETSLAWRRADGRAFANAISWQCRRSSGICAGLQDQKETIRRITGLPLDPLVSASKWSWLLQHDGGLRTMATSGDLCLGTVESWLIYKLTGGSLHVTDHTNASRTALLNLQSLQWDDSLLGLFGISYESLPQLTWSSSHIGIVSAIPELAGVPIVSAIGDSHAAMAGHGSYSPGSVKATYGTGSSLMMLTPGIPKTSLQLARTIAWSRGEGVQYGLEGNITMTGSGVQWTGEFLGLPDPVNDVIALAERLKDTEGVYMVPAMVGLGAPYWDAEARGTLTGLNRGSTRAHMARAALEAIAYQIADVFHAMRQEAEVDLPMLHTDGGGTRNDTLMQFQSDLLQVPVQRSACEDLSALGAAWLGGLTLGWWNTWEELSSLPQQQTTFSPGQSLDHKYHGWKQAVNRTRSIEVGS